MNSSLVLGVLAVLSCLGLLKAKRFTPDQEKKLLLLNHVEARQSPINLESNHNVELPMLTFGQHSEDVPYTVTNTGKTVLIKVNLRRTDRPFLEDGPLINRYYLVNIHFHWDQGNTNGTEHALNGKKYAAEVHAVYGNSLYKEGILTKVPNAFFVLGILVEVCSNQKNLPVEELLNLAEEVKSPKSTYESTGREPLMWSDELSEGGEYYLYKGSLTTPPFSENVKFAIKTTPYCVGQETINNLREVLEMEDVPITDSIRDLQPRNNRGVLKASMTL